MTLRFLEGGSDDIGRQGGGGTGSLECSETREKVSKKF
jgi:hypothetical protein